MVKLNHLAICVSDEKRSRDWYIAHFGFRMEFEVSERNTIALQDDADLTLFLVKDARSAHPSCTLVFQVADVEAKHRELSSIGLRFEKTPQKLDWGYGAELLDPDGYLIHLWDEESMRRNT